MSEVMTMRRANRLVRQEAPETAGLYAQIRAFARPLRRPEDLDPLLERIGESRYVLLGEASHGTAEYYTWRATLSQRLIREKGFSFIAVEGDWPVCYLVNRCVKDLPEAGESVVEVLHAFERWPTWMWANEEVVALAEWLRRHNEGLAEEKKAGFYGLDVYSLWESLYAVMGYLHRVDPAALPAVWRAFRCFEPYGEDVQEYAQAARFVPNACEGEVIGLLTRLRHDAPAYQADGREGFFQAEQNALVLKNAEAYYRAMVRGGPDSWNIRDRHMTETLERLMTHHGPDAKTIVWEHNTHIGDARFTDMAEDGMVNVGQLVRQGHGGEGVVLVGFGSHHGSVIAGRQWGAPMEQMPVPPAREGSWEHILHRAGADNKLLLLADADPAREWLEPRGHRAIGVVYQPEYEHYGNYVPTVLPRRYDAFLYLDETQALHPLHVPAREDGEVPETFPSGV
jgi:erythromycin esterase